MDEIEISAAAEVRQFCESVSESATKNIRLLKAIEQTVGWLTWLQGRAKADAIFAAKATEHLKVRERIKTVDVDGTLCALFEDVESDLQQLHDLLVSKRNAAKNAPDLDGENKATLLDEYTVALTSIADLHNLMVELRWAVGEHDADLEKPTGPVFSDKEKLREYLATLH